jgi:hypothetical protein
MSRDGRTASPLPDGKALIAGWGAEIGEEGGVVEELKKLVLTETL